jgi:FdhE protein
MAKSTVPQHAPIPIGDVVTPPFARLPEPDRVFAARAERFRTLAKDHDLGPYLSFLADLCDAQHRVQEHLAPPELPEADVLARAREFAMPPLDRGGISADPAFERTLAAFLPLARDAAKPEAAAAALERVIVAGKTELGEMSEAVLSHAIPADRIAEHVYVAAVLQVHLARLASGLDASSLVPVGDGICPACGGAPVASIVVDWPGAHGARYCGCSLCGTLWNYVRVKCALCSSTKGISYKEIEGGPGIIKVETCGSCHGYLKILHQHKHPSLDIVADDVASLALDLLMQGSEFHRGGFNPYLIGY